MRTPRMLLRASPLLLLSTTAWALAPAGEQAPGDGTFARLEVRLERVGVPSAELLEWELLVDGERVAREGGGARNWQWQGAFAPGAHTVGVRIRYERDTKTVVNRLQGDRVGLTFVAGGARWVGEDFRVDALPASVVRLAAALDENPHDVDDRLLLAREQRELAETPGAAGRWRGDFEVERLVQERASYVVALLSPQLVREARATGDARVRFAVDPRGYVRSFALEQSTRSELLDRAVGQVLQLAQPFPAFDGYLTVTLPFGTTVPAAHDTSGLGPSPLTKLPDYRRQR